MVTTHHSTFLCTLINMQILPATAYVRGHKQYALGLVVLFYTRPVVLLMEGRTVCFLSTFCLFPNNPELQFQQPLIFIAGINRIIKITV
mgnify:CR=1 FL=1